MLKVKLLLKTQKLKWKDIVYLSDNEFCEKINFDLKEFKLLKN